MACSQASYREKFSQLTLAVQFAMLISSQVVKKSHELTEDKIKE
jgi:hypothetical protein